MPVADKSWIAILLCAIAILFGLSIFLPGEQNSANTDNIGYAINLYQNFSLAVNSFSSSNNVDFASTDTIKQITFSISDDAVYKIAYVSVNGTSWQPITLTGTVLSGNWLKQATSGTYNVPRGNIPNGTGIDNYLIIYSCTKNITGSSTAWDCHNNKWQIKTFNTTKTDATNPSNPTSKIQIYAAGRSGGGIYPVMELIINNNNVASFNVTGDALASTFIVYNYTYNGIINNDTIIRVNYSNDEYGTTRDLRVDKIVIDGLAYESESQANINTGMWDGVNCGGTPYPGNEWLNCTGYIQYSLTGTTACIAESNATFCSRLGKSCGSVTALDNCNISRTVSSCGTCLANQTCNSNNICMNNVTSCLAETNSTFCSRLGKTCGIVTALDNCNISRAISSCGACLSNQSCTNNICVNNVVTPICGDGICNGAETCSSCPGDCGSCQLATNYSRTFYVSSSTGLDSYNGTSQSSPWKTITKVNSMTFKPGDGILFKSGDTWKGTLVVSNSGNASRPITYSSYGSGNMPEFNGVNTGQIVQIQLTGKQFVIIDGIKIIDNTISATDHSIMANIDYGIEVNNGLNITIKNCDISIVGCGIQLDHGSSNIVIANNYIHNLRMVVNTAGGNDDWGANPIIVGSSNNIITNNRLEECWANSLDYDYDGGAIEFYSNGGAAISNNKIMYNTVINCNGFLEIGGGAGGACANNIVAYNKMINCGIIGSYHTTDSMKMDISNLQYYNNDVIQTIQQYTKPGVLFYSNGASPAGMLVVKNNIFWLADGGTDVTWGELNSGQMIHSNNIYRISSGSSVGLTLSTTESSSSSAVLFSSASGDPSTWNYNLSSGSPAIDKGITVSGLDKDIEGTGVPQGPYPDIGAYEYK